MPTIAVVGASPDRRKFGNKCVRAYVRAGYSVFPVHPTATEVEGLPAYRTVADVPADRLDRVSVYLPPAVGVPAMSDIVKKPVGELWLNPGADAPDVVAEAERLGLPVVRGCSIVDLGLSPRMFPDE
jgi:predicted CoA-binding protein